MSLAIMKFADYNEPSILKLPQELKELLVMHRNQKRICFNCDKEFYGLGLLQVKVKSTIDGVSVPLLVEYCCLPPNFKINSLFL
jgi:hypothetical protein